MMKVQVSDTMKVVFLITYLANMGSEVLIPCFFGSRLTAKSDRLCTEIFSCDWPDAPHRLKVTMAMFMQSVQPPMELFTYEKRFKIALPTFVMVNPDDRMMIRSIVVHQCLSIYSFLDLSCCLFVAQLFTRISLKSGAFLGRSRNFNLKPFNICDCIPLNIFIIGFYIPFVFFCTRR